MGTTRLHGWLRIDKHGLIQNLSISHLNGANDMIEIYNTITQAMKHDGKISREVVQDLSIILFDLFAKEHAINKSIARHVRNQDTDQAVKELSDESSPFAIRSDK